jgi:hypothetical protein
MNELNENEKLQLKKINETMIQWIMVEKEFLAPFDSIDKTFKRECFIQDIFNYFFKNSINDLEKIISFLQKYGLFEFNNCYKNKILRTYKSIFKISIEEDFFFYYGLEDSRFLNRFFIKEYIREFYLDVTFDRSKKKYYCTDLFVKKILDKCININYLCVNDYKNLEDMIIFLWSQTNFSENQILNFLENLETDSSFSIVFNDYFKEELKELDGS